MIVSDGEGNEIPGAVVSASGAGAGCLNPAVLCHNNSPVWEEVFRLDLGVDTLQRPGTHLRLEYYHCSLKERQERKLVGFSWLELMRDTGTVIMDGDHELGVFRAESGEQRVSMSSLSYLSGSSGPVRSGKESVLIRTQLCSTKLTQNVDLMRLLNWRASTDTIPSILASVTNTGRELSVTAHHSPYSCHKSDICNKISDYSFLGCSNRKASGKMFFDSLAPNLVVRDVTQHVTCN